VGALGVGLAFSKRHKFRELHILQRNGKADSLGIGQLKRHQSQNTPGFIHQRPAGISGIDRCAELIKALPIQGALPAEHSRRDGFGQDHAARAWIADGIDALAGRASGG